MKCEHATAFESLGAWRCRECDEELPDKHPAVIAALAAEGYDENGNLPTPGDYRQWEKDGCL